MRLSLALIYQLFNSSKNNIRKFLARPNPYIHLKTSKLDEEQPNDQQPSNQSDRLKLMISNTFISLRKGTGKCSKRKQKECAKKEGKKVNLT